MSHVDASNGADTVPAPAAASARPTAPGTTTSWRTASQPSATASHQAPRAARSCGNPAVLWTNPSNHGQYHVPSPQMNLIAGSLGVRDGTLRVLLTMQDLQQQVPTGSTDAFWGMHWDYAGETWSAEAELHMGGAPTFHYGTGDPADGTATTGSFGSGPNGVVEIDVPLPGIASPPKGAVLRSPTGYTYAVTSILDNNAGEIDPQYGSDQGGPQADYRLPC